VGDTASEERLGRLFALLLFPLASTCAGSLPEVPRGPHPPSGGNMPLVVDSKPPAVLIERIEGAPYDDCLWADGYWSFGAEGWQWNAGRWVRDLDDCYFAEPSLVWVAAVNQPGALFFTAGQWYHQGSGQPCGEPKECSSR
jgi:hypothetical protein